MSATSLINKAQFWQQKLRSPSLKISTLFHFCYHQR